MARNPDNSFLHNFEKYFPSISRLRESLLYLRRYVPNLGPFGFREDFDAIDRCLESLESAMIAVEEEVINQTFRVRPVDLGPNLEIFLDSFLRTHHERIRLARTIEAINPVDINLSVVIEHYRVVLSHLYELRELFPVNFDESYEYSPRYVEQFFPSIDQLQINLARLRERVTSYPSFRLIDDLDKVDRCLENLKSAMIAGEDLFFDQINRGRTYEQFSRENIDEFLQTIFLADEERLNLCDQIEEILLLEYGLDTLMALYRAVIDHLNSLVRFFPAIDLEDFHFL
ncbi:hypothetical protein SSS_02028 [Sarcoptes scabiei]|uniref:Uncharacterized protein n=1 Tax=Sarcoptes scabiei TaxID=52283 RepID=A0A834RHA1_SARSC|nr:hypothetical protein SSS_02028 [Sarcoptes scabiei]